MESTCWPSEAAGWRGTTSPRPSDHLHMVVVTEQSTINAQNHALESTIRLNYVLYVLLTHIVHWGPFLKNDCKEKYQNLKSRVQVSGKLI